MFETKHKRFNRTLYLLAQNTASEFVFIVFHCVMVVYMSFCSLIKEITPKIHMLCFVLINSVIFNISCVWVLL